MHARRIVAARSAGPVLAGLNPDGAGWLTLSGPYGCGKTRLGESVFSHLRRVDPFANGPWVAGTEEFREDSRRPGCVFTHVNAFIDRTLGGDYRFPEYLGREWLVVVDDLGANRQGSENSREAASDAISRLCAARNGKMTIFTTNWTVSEIAARVDGRVASRLIRDGDGNTFHRITAGDYALRKR